MTLRITLIYMKIIFPIIFYKVTKWTIWLIYPAIVFKLPLKRLLQSHGISCHFPSCLALTFICLMLGPLCPYITTNLTFDRSPWKFPVLHCLWVDHYIEQWTLFFLVNCSPIMHIGNMLINNSNPWTSVFYILLIPTPILITNKV